VPVKFDGQGLAGKPVRRDVRQHAGGIDIDGVPAGRLDDGDAMIGDVAAEVAGGDDAVVQVVGVEHLFETDGDGVQVASGRPP